MSEEAGESMTLDPAAELKLDVARQRVADLVAAVPGQDEVEAALAGAGSKFLADTELEAVKARAGRKKRKRRSNDPKVDDGWVTLRFRLTPEQRDVVYAAIDKACEAAGKDKSGAYKGWGLEMVCGDYLAGHPMLGGIGP